MPATLRRTIIEERSRFLALLADGLRRGAPIRLVLAKYHGDEPDLVRLQARPVAIRGETRLSFVYSYRTRDVTSNLSFPEALQRVEQLLRHDFRRAHLIDGDRQTQLTVTRRGKALLRTEKQSSDAGDSVEAPEAMQGTPDDEAAHLAHNRSKRRLLSMDRPFLQALGVTDRHHHLVPTMARKWKQINRFVEVFADAWKASSLGGRPGTLRTIDFGSGKGYLTFALHDYLRDHLGIDAQVYGVELRADLVKFCNETTSALGIDGLQFRQGDIASHHESHSSDERFDVMIALHACDTATDDAIHQGIRAGAEIIMCAPCCHKQLRPQLLSPHPLRPILQHGVHLGQEAEMLTDGLRALLLEAAGYDTRVFEFISLEHTSKNKMILAVKHPVARDAAPVLAQIQEIKAFYGIREQRLESLLAGQEH